MGQGLLPNTVGLVVNSCIVKDTRIVDRKTQYKYQFTFQVTLPPPSGNDYPKPDFQTNMSASFHTEEEPAGTTRKSLFVNYQSIVPTVALPDPPPASYVVYPGLIHETGWEEDQIERGAVTFEGTNRTAAGKKVRAKSSTTVGSPTPNT